MSEVTSPSMTWNPSSQAAVADQSPLSRTWLDRLGIGASLACAIHCMAAPFMLLLLPAAGATWSHPAVHWILAILVLPLALWVIFNGYRKHGRRRALVAAGIGSAMIVAGLIAPMVISEPIFSITLASSSPAGDATMLASNESMLPMQSEAVGCTEPCCPSVTEDAEAGTTAMAFPPGGLITLIGSIFLVFAHGANLMACRCCKSA